jgi:uncharacterized protein (UPF0332 family)
MMPEQEDLFHQAHDSLAAAKILDAQGYHGFAASRAYYAMFYIVEAFLLGQGLAFSRHGAYMRSTADGSEPTAKYLAVISAFAISPDLPKTMLSAEHSAFSAPHLS